jgi:hypothetical protein
MSTPLRKAVRHVKFAISPSVRKRVNILAQKGPLTRERIVARAKVMGVAANREKTIERLDKQLRAIHKQIDAIANKPGMESKRGKLISQTFDLQKRLAHLRKRQK